MRNEDCYTLQEKRKKIFIIENFNGKYNIIIKSLWK